MSRRRTRNDWRASHDIDRAVKGIVSRGGDLDSIATEVREAYVRHGWKPPGPTGLNVSRCRTHPGTALQNGRCPICLWNPNGPEN